MIADRQGRRSPLLPPMREILPADLHQMFADHDQWVLSSGQGGKPIRIFNTSLTKFNFEDMNLSCARFELCDLMHVIAYAI
jgi:hypothetical protein